MTAIRFGQVVLDCPDAPALATFYANLLGIEPASEDFLRLGDHTTFWFQQVDDYQAPTWPTQERGQQLHLDFFTPDMAAAQAHAIEVGARLVDDSEDSFHVFLDPAGHPFCLCREDA